MIIRNEYVNLRYVTFAAFMPSPQADVPDAVELHLSGAQRPLLYTGEEARKVWAALRDASASYFTMMKLSDALATQEL